nr:unnamed protein product [Callosobruchus analis]
MEQRLLYLEEIIDSAKETIVGGDRSRAVQHTEVPHQDGGMGSEYKHADLTNMEDSGHSCGSSVVSDGDCSGPFYSDLDGVQISDLEETESCKFHRLVFCRGTNVRDLFRHARTPAWVDGKLCHWWLEMPNASRKYIQTATNDLTLDNPRRDLSIICDYYIFKTYYLLLGL